MSNQLCVDMDLHVLLDFKVNYKMSQDEMFDKYFDMVNKGNVIYQKVVNEDTGQKVIILELDDNFWFISSTIAKGDNQNFNSILFFPIKEEDVNNEIKHLEENQYKRHKVSY